ncbi:MAG: hypothetical protein AAF432_02040 [Planctomycetota bacterium]
MTTDAAPTPLDAPDQPHATGDTKPAGILIALSAYAVIAPPVGLAVLLASSATIEGFWSGLPMALALVLAVALGVLLVGSALLPSIGFSGYMGYLFHGEIRAYGAVVIAIIGATFLGIWWARRLSTTAARDLLARHPRGQRMLDTMERESGRSLMTLVFMSRLSPHMPFAFTNILVAQLHQSLTRLAIVSTLGLLPRSLLGVAIGAGLRSAQEWSGSSPYGAWMWIITVVVILVFVRITVKAYRAARVNNEASAHEEAVTAESN